MSQDTYVQSPIGGKNGLDVNINSAVPIPVFIVDTPPGSTPQIVEFSYNGITSVASSVLTSVISYTVPLLKTFYLLRVEFSGTNIAQYTLTLNASMAGVKRTYFGGDLDGEFNFESFSNNGFKLNASETMNLSVEHFRPNLGDFDATIIGLLVG